MKVEKEQAIALVAALRGETMRGNQGRNGQGFVSFVSNIPSEELVERWEELRAEYENRGEAVKAKQAAILSAKERLAKARADLRAATGK